MEVSTLSHAKRNTVIFTDDEKASNIKGGTVYIAICTPVRLWIKPFKVANPTEEFCGPMG